MHRYRSPILLILPLLSGCSGARPAEPTVRPGIDVLLSDSIHLIRGRRVGLLTNQTGVDRAGVGDVDRLVAAKVQLTAIYSPEHGFRGVLDDENIKDTRDSATGVPIFSLYGAVRAPTGAMLESIDVLVIDLQDIGARTFTYISTTLLAMRAAQAAGRRVVVLDRPNPIGGLVQGPVLDSGFASFIGMLPIPIRHGMTMGELARLGNAELGIGADLVVVPAAGWSRGLWFDQVGLPWVRPSPNMPNLESATHYPGTVLFEATNISVGRGTPVAFQVIAAPWLDPGRVRGAIGSVPGAAAGDTSITPEAPSDGKYGGRQLSAIKFRVTDRQVYDPTYLAVKLLVALRSVHPDSFTVDSTGLDSRVGNNQVRRSVTSGESPDSIWSHWRAAIDQFDRRRAPYLLYR